MAFLRCILLPVFMTTLVLQAVLCDITKRSNPTAALKPQTPIAGTNLFLNTPYKWHDHTKPGCYVTWLRENSWRKVKLFCNRDDQKWYDTSDAVWIIERREGVESYEEYNGEVTVKNVGANECLSTVFNQFGRHAHVFDCGSLTRFRFRSDISNKNHLLLNCWESMTVNQKPIANHRADLFYSSNHSESFPYSFVPAIELNARMYDFVFTQPMDGQIARHSSKKDLIDSYDISNASPATLSRTITVSEKITNEFAWGLSESLKVFAKVTASVGIPFIADGKVETGFELTVAANQNWKNSDEKSFAMSYDVSVPPYSNVRVSAWYEKIEDISMEYTARTEITGTTSRISVFDDMVNDARATGEMIRRHLEHSKFDGTIVEIKEHSVITQIKGTMTASVGVRGQLNVDGKTVATQKM